MEIKIRYSAVDGYRAKTRAYTTLRGAQGYAWNRVGKHPEIGNFYAVSGDGVGKVTWSGCTAAELFPEDQP